MVARLQRGFGCLLILFAHATYEANPLSLRCADKSLLLAAVPDRRSRSVDAGVERGFGNNAAAPDGCDQIIPADHMVAVPDQIVQEIENLRFHRHCRGASPKFSPLRVERKIFKQIQHLGSPAVIRLGS